MPLSNSNTGVIYILSGVSGCLTSPAARGRYTYHIEGQFHFGFILFL